MTLKILSLEKADINKLNLFLKHSGTHHYQADFLLSWPKAHEYVAKIIRNFSDKNPVFIAVENENIKGLIGFRKKDWDTRHFSYHVASIDYFFVEKNGGRFAASLLMSKFNKWVQKNAIKFVSIKVFPDINIIRIMEENGFYYVGNEFILSKLLPDPDLDEFPAAGIRFLKMSDTDDLLRIAKSASWPGRFHSDPNINKKKADQLYVDWLRNGAKKDNAKVTVLEVNRKASGFILWSTERLVRGGQTLLVGDQELVAVDPEIRGKGYGKILYRGTLIQMQKAGVNLVKTSIAANNAPALNNQARLGFCFNYGMAIFHKFTP